MWCLDRDVGVTPEAFKRFVEIASSTKSIKHDGELFEFWPSCPGCHRIFYKTVWVDVIEWEPKVVNGVKCFVTTVPEEFYDGDVYPPHPEHDLFPLSAGIVDGHRYPIPRDSAAHLRRVYGDWQRFSLVPALLYAVYHPITAFRQTWRPVAEPGSRHVDVSSSSFKGDLGHDVLNPRASGDCTRPLKGQPVSHSAEDGQEAQVSRRILSTLPTLTLSPRAA